MHRTTTLLTLSVTVMLAAVSASAADMPQVKPHHAAVIKDCTVCHTAENAVAGNQFVVPDDKVCMSCHGSYADMAKKTAAGEEPNPHDSAHYGSSLSCSACHAQHAESRPWCNDCHEFRYKKLK